MSDDKKIQPHTIDDHMFGDFFAHEHGPDADHDHDDIDPGPLEENPIWLRDNVALRPIRLGPGLLVFLDRLKRRTFLRNWEASITQE